MISVIRLFLILFFLTLITACSEAPNSSGSQQNSVQAANVPLISLNDTDAIIKSVGKPVLITETEEIDGQKETRYFFQEKNNPNFQIEIHPKNVVIAWYLYKDNSKHSEVNKENIQLAKKIAISLLGIEGESIVNNALDDKAGKLIINSKNVRHYGGSGLYSITIEKS